MQSSITDDIYSGSADGTLSNIVYDDLYRLKNLYSAGIDANLPYSYDSIGNITYNSEGAGSSYTYGGSSPHAVTSAYGKSYSYDACGNMTARGNDTLIYDSRNRLVKVVKDSNDIEFGYSADGERLYKKFNSTVTQVWIGDIYEEKDGKVLCHVFAGDKLIATFEPASALSRLIDKNPLLRKSYDYASTAYAGMFGQGRTPLTLLGFGILTGLYFGLRFRKDKHGGYSFFYKGPYRQFFIFTIIVAVFVAATPEICYAGTPTYDPVFYYYHSDHLGSTNIMTDRNGELVQHYGYLPFGNERYENNTQAFSMTNRYTGQQLDEDTGLYFYGSRYYDPELARFIQPDSIVPDYNTSQVLNRYTYCNNNPLLFVDPSGNIFGIDDLIIAVVIGALIGGGMAAAQGGNFWKGAAVGAIAGACGFIGAEYGFIGSVVGAAAGGALGALVTGDDPAMAAATAAIMAAVVQVAFKTKPTSAADDTLGEQHLKDLKYTNGSNSTGGGASSEWELHAEYSPCEASSSGAMVEVKTVNCLYEIDFKTYLKATGEYAKEKFKSFRPGNDTLNKLEEMSAINMKEKAKFIGGLDYDSIMDMDLSQAGIIHSKVGAIEVKNLKPVGKVFVKETAETLITKGIGKGITPGIESLPVGGIKKTLLKELAPGPIYKGAEKGLKDVNNKIRGPKNVEKIKKK